MECKHPKLVRIENMPEGTYRCERCNDLLNVTFGPLKVPVAVFGTPKEGE